MFIKQKKNPLFKCWQNRVIQKLVSKNNVLSNGFRARRFFDSGMQQMNNVECFLPNSLVNQLKTCEWEKLLSVIGDST